MLRSSLTSQHWVNTLHSRTNHLDATKDSSSSPENSLRLCRSSNSSCRDFYTFKYKIYTSWHELISTICRYYRGYLSIIPNHFFWVWKMNKIHSIYPSEKEYNLPRSLILKGGNASRWGFFQFNIVPLDPALKGGACGEQTGQFRNCLEVCSYNCR